MQERTRHAMLQKKSFLNLCMALHIWKNDRFVDHNQSSDLYNFTVVEIIVNEIDFTYL